MDEDKILSSLDKIQREIDSLKQEIKSHGENSNNGDFKTIVHRVEKESNRDQNPGSARLEGNIETI